MAPPSPEKKMIALKSKDGQTFAVEEATARMSKALEKKIEDDNMLFNLIVASYDLDIKPLLDLMSETVANMVKADCREKRGTFSTEIDDFIPEKFEDDFTSEEFGGWPFEE